MHKFEFQLAVVCEVQVANRRFELSWGGGGGFEEVEVFR